MNPVLCVQWYLIKYDDLRSFGKFPLENLVMTSRGHAAGLGVQHRGGGLHPPEHGAGVPGPHVLHHRPPGPRQAACHQVDRASDWPTLIALSLVSRLSKFIAATAGVSRLQLHADSVRLAVLLPQTTRLEIWNIDLVTRLHR